ncbi:hypothetical protein LY78DRAFT_595166, partial [Colletotrichum sublineola]
EIYYGLIETAADAKIIIEACKTGLLACLKCTLSKLERESIRSGSVFVFQKSTFGRWVDKKTWGRRACLGSRLILLSSNSCVSAR